MLESITLAAGSFASNPFVNAAPTLAVIVAKAKARIANHVQNTGVECDPFLMVIADEIGGLVHTQGNLSFLMPATPIINQPFANQINLDVADEYERRQLAVWEEILTDGEHFQVAPNLNAAILPFLAEEEQFTVTVFIARQA